MRKATETRTLIPLRLIPESMAEKCDSKDISEFRFEKNTPIDVEFDVELRNDDKVKLTEIFRNQITRKGMLYEPGAKTRIRLTTIIDREPTAIAYYAASDQQMVAGPFYFRTLGARVIAPAAVARATPAQQREIGKLSLDLYSYKVEIVHNDRVLWETSQKAPVPNNFSKDANDNETLEETVKRRMKPNASWYQNIALPNIFEYPIRGQILGKSTVGEEMNVYEFKLETSDK